MSKLPSELSRPRILNFLTAPKTNRFLVPAVRAEGKQAALKAAGFENEPCWAIVGAFDVQAVLVTLPDRARLNEALRLIYDGYQSLAYESVVAILEGNDELFLPIVLPKLGHVTFVKDESADKSLSDKDKRRRDRAERAYKIILTRLSQISRKAIIVHMDVGDARVHEPFVGEPDEIHIYPACAPPGHTDSEYIVNAFKIFLHEEGKSLWSRKPTLGRSGDVLSDSDGVKLVQRTSAWHWYVLIPLFTFFFEPNSTQVFEKLMALAWNKPLEPVSTRKKATIEEFVETVVDWDDDYLPILEKAKVDELALIDKLQKELQIAYAGLKRNGDYLAMAKDVKRRRTRKSRARENFRRIASHPLVERVEIDKEELMIYTRGIVGNHEGVSYNFGSFVLRMASDGSIAVWNEHPTHPKRIPHPHISPTGTVCYGNATQAITKASGELRFADAIEFILRWLAEGYEEPLAAVKIHEWPRVEAATEGGVS